MQERNEALGKFRDGLPTRDPELWLFAGSIPAPGASGLIRVQSELPGPGHDEKHLMGEFQAATRQP